MIVKLENGIQVIVKGTKFNLTSYKNDDNVSALLLSGNITVLRTKHSKQEEIKVKPNERIWIEKKERQKVQSDCPGRDFTHPRLERRLVDFRRDTDSGSPEKAGTLAWHDLRSERPGNSGSKIYRPFSRGIHFPDTGNHA